jgi:thymidine phosphorylase
MTSLPLPLTSEDSALGRLVDAARDGGPWDAEEVARLATHLANSGERLTWPVGLKAGDVASTGGPGSLSTLLAPLALRVGGCTVVKLAVSGRPAGAIDTLATLPDYRVRFSSSEVRDVVASCGFAHFIGGNSFAPLDAALFAYRRRVSAINVPTLAAASLLSKKLAVGVRSVGLDIRVGPQGNFGSTIRGARENALLFCKAAQLLGIDAVAFVGDGILPQPWIGRGESIVALALCLGVVDVHQECPWLTNHSARCWEMARAVLGAATASLDCKDLFPREAIRDVLDAHLAAQGSSLAAFRQRAEAVMAAARISIVASEDGVLAADMGLVRDALVELQGDLPSVFRDPCGVRMLVRPGARVVGGQEIALARCERSDASTTLMSRLQSAFKITPAGTEQAPADSDSVEIVRA